MLWCALHQWYLIGEPAMASGQEGPHWKGKGGACRFQGLRGPLEWAILGRVRDDGAGGCYGQLWISW